VTVFLDSGRAIVSDAPSPATTTAEQVEVVGHTRIEDLPDIPSAFEPGGPDDG
jgi:hypothetical protein